jgi:tRNA(Arg) A34 adenosine deaminase TadA
LREADVMNGSLWNTLAPPWQACLEEAWSAYCAGAVPVGAVVVAADGELLARGRNQQSDCADAPGLVRHHTLAHAELNALIACRRYDRDGTQALYTLLEPCPLCLGAFYMSGIRELHFAARDPVGGSSNLLGSTPYLARKPIRLHAPADPALESVATALLAEFTWQVRGADAAIFAADWHQTNGRGAALGEALFRSGELSALRDAGADARRMTDALGARLEDPG